MGGGTGGHILPLLAVAHKLKQQSDIKVIAIADRQSKFADLLKNSTDIDELVLIDAGKFRRYPNQSLLRTLLDIKTLILNIRDGFRTLIGISQAIKALRKVKPSIIFIKGGYVGVPVGTSAKILSIPFITHDSDAHPGLANRIIGRWAKLHTVAMSVDLYNYPKEKTLQVGIPISDEFTPVNLALKNEYRKYLKISKQAKVVFITGGSQGAKKLNKVIASITPDLLKINNIFIVHQTGRGGVRKDIESTNYLAFEYSNELYKYSGSADIIITRAGSTVAEFAVQHKPIIVVPADHLADNHQIKNANILKNTDSAIVLQEDRLLEDPTLLLSAIKELLYNQASQKKLSTNLSKLYPDDATEKITKLLLESYK